MRTNFIALLTTLVWTVTSCVEYIDLDTSKETPTVVECILTNDTTQTLRLYQMRVLSDKENLPIENAQAFLLKKDRSGNLQTVAEFHKEKGIIWKARYQPEFDTEYSISITVPDQEVITASTKFPKDLRLIKCGRYAFRKNDLGYDGGSVTAVAGMLTAEIREGKSYTEWRDIVKEDGTPFKAYLEVSEDACKIWVFPHTDTTEVGPGNNALNIFNEEYYLFNGSRQPFSKYVSTNHSGADRLNIAPGRLADLEYWSHPSKNGKTNYSSWCLYLCPDIPLFSDFVRIDHPANYRNGLSEHDLENNFNYSDRCFFIEGDYSDTYNPNAANGFLNEVHFVSDEYDTFLRALYVKIKDKDDFILSSYDYENLPSNISGGVGIFGADNATWDMEETISRLTRKDFLIWEELCPNAPKENK